MADGPTPHLEGTRGDYAPTVLVPGDPRRARFIAETYFDDPRQVNAVRGAEGFTGSYQGRPVSVQSVGMGVPSVAIYYTELIRFYGVQTLIRVGSCGGLSESLTLGDVIVATAGGTDSAVLDTLNEGLRVPPVATWELLRAAVDAAERLDIPVAVGPVWTADLFYHPDDTLFPRLRARGVLGVEMEAAVLYALAAIEQISALCLLTVSDDLVRGEVMSSRQREDSFDQMVRLALEVS